MLLAGDAAHLKQTSPETLLDTYHAERHPVAARALHNTMAQTALIRSNARTDALRDTMSELLGMDEPRQRIAAMMSGLDIHYDLREPGGFDITPWADRAQLIDAKYAGPPWCANHLVRSARCGVARRGTRGCPEVGEGPDRPTGMRGSLPATTWPCICTTRQLIGHSR